MKYEYKFEFQNSIYRIFNKKIIYLIIYLVSIYKNTLFDIIISIK